MSADLLARATRTTFTGELRVAPFVEATLSGAKSFPVCVTKAQQPPTSKLSAQDEFMRDLELMWQIPGLAELVNDDSDESEAEEKALSPMDAMFMDSVATRVANVIVRIIPEATGKTPSQAANQVDSFSLKLDARWEKVREQYVMLGRDMLDAYEVSEALADFLSKHPASPVWQLLDRAENVSGVKPKAEGPIEKPKQVKVEQRIARSLDKIDEVLTGIYNVNKSLADELKEHNIYELEAKGGPGSGDHDHDGQPGQLGGSAPAGASGRTDGIPGATGGRVADVLREAGGTRLQFRKHKLGREVLSDAAAIKRLSEKPYGGIRDRIAVRKLTKQMDKKLKELDIPESEVFRVLDELNPADQAMLANAARLERSEDGRAKTIAKNIGKWMLGMGAENLGRRFAPPLITTPDVMGRFNPAETAAWMAAYDKPTRATEYMKAFAKGDMIHARNIKAQSFRNVISNRHSDQFNEFRTAGGRERMWQTARENLALSRNRTQDVRNRLSRGQVPTESDLISEQGRRFFNYVKGERPPGPVGSLTRYNADRRKVGLAPIGQAEFSILRKRGDV